MIRLFLGIDFANTEMMLLLIFLCAMVLQAHPFLGPSIYRGSKDQGFRLVRYHLIHVSIIYPTCKEGIRTGDIFWDWLIQYICAHVSMLNPHFVGLRWYS